jgi:hypothetical protein
LLGVGADEEWVGEDEEERVEVVWGCFVCSCSEEDRVEEGLGPSFRDLSSRPLLVVVVGGFLGVGVGEEERVEAVEEWWMKWVILSWTFGLLFSLLLSSSFLISVLSFLISLVGSVGWGEGRMEGSAGVGGMWMVMFLEVKFSEGMGVMLQVQTMSMLLGWCFVVGVVVILPVFYALDEQKDTNK